MKKKLFKLMGWLAGGAAAVASVMLLSAGGFYFSGSSPITYNSGGSGIIGNTTNAVTNTYYSVLYGTNIAFPLSLAAGTSTNLFYRLDASTYKDISFQFTGSSTTTNSTNSVAITLGANNDGTTNIATVLVWTVGITNINVSSNQTYITNFSEAVSGAYKYFYVLNITTTSASGSGSAVLTNDYFTINGE